MALRTGILIFATMFYSVTAFAATGPQIRFDAQEHDFGSVVHGSSPKTEFAFTNTGDETLIVKKLRSDCGCTKGIGGSREVPPGSQSTITAQIHTEGLSAGRHGNTVLVYTNDRKQPLVRLKLRYKVVRHITLSPRSVGTTLKKTVERVTVPLTATNHWENPITLKAPTEATPNGCVTLDPGEIVVPPGDTVRFTISIPVVAAQSKGFCSGVALIETDDPMEKVLRVRYLIRLPGKQSAQAEDRG
jgi:hypothetical protein